MKRFPDRISTIDSCEMKKINGENIQKKKNNE